MKNKLIAIILTTAIIGGVGSTTYASEICVNNASDVVVSKSKSNCKYEKKFDRLFNKKRPFYNLGSCNNKPNNYPGYDSGNVDELPPTTEDKPSVDEVIPPTTEDKPSTDEGVPPTTGDKPSTDVVIPPTIEETPNVSEKFMEQVEQKIYEKINIERSKAGVSKLSYNSTVEKYARIKSQDMGDRRYFNHVDPEGNLITVKMKQDGVKYNAWGENIAYIGGVSDADALATQFMNNWMNSQGHRENILSTNFTSVGVGVYKSGNRVYATQEFYR